MRIPRELREVERQRVGAVDGQLFLGYRVSSSAARSRSISTACSRSRCREAVRQGALAGPISTMICFSRIDFLQQALDDPRSCRNAARTPPRYVRLLIARLTQARSQA